MTKSITKKTTRVVQNKQVDKKEPGDLIRKYLLPISLATTILYFLWIILDWSGHIVNDAGAMFEGVRYAGIIITVFVLIVMGLFLAYTTFECFKFKRNMMKESLSTLIFNILVCLALLVLFLLVAVRVSQKSVWNGESDTTGSTYAVSARLMGATFVLVTYISIYLLAKNRIKQLNNNIQMIKSIIWTMTVTIALSLILMAFRIVGGFFSFEKIIEASIFARLAAGALRVGNIAISMFGLSTIFVICIIPLLFLIEKNEELIKKQILISALIGGISLILFVVTLGVMNETIIKFEQAKTGTTVCTILLLVNFAATILFTIFSFINNKKFFGLYIDFSTLKIKKNKKTKKVEPKTEPKEPAKEEPKEEEEKPVEVEPITPVVEETKIDEPKEESAEPLNSSEINEDELEVEIAQEVEEPIVPTAEEPKAEEVSMFEEPKEEPVVNATEETKVDEPILSETQPTIPTEETTAISEEPAKEEPEETVAPIVEKTIATLVEETKHEETIEPVVEESKPFVVEDIKYPEQPKPTEEEHNEEAPIIDKKDIELIEPEPITNPDLITPYLDIKPESSEENKKEEETFKSIIDDASSETIISTPTLEDNQTSSSEPKPEETNEENK